MLTHEIAHVLGLNQQHGGSYARNSPLTGNGQCTSYIPTGQGFGGITTSVCYHEVETIIRARNGSGYQYDPDFYTSPLAFGTDVTPRTTSVQTGSNRTFVVNNWSLKPSGTIARGATSLGWTSTAPSQVMVVSAGVVQGEQAGVGQGAITVRLNGLTSALPTGYQFWTPFKSRGDSVSVTVVATPPPPAVISIDQVPITTAGAHTLTYSGPGTPGSTVWYIDDSRTISTNPDATLYSSGWTTQVIVGAGSYTLAVTVDGMTQEFPVCTEGGQSLQAPQKNGGAGTNAVGGCAPGGGSGDQ